MGQTVSFVDLLAIYFAIVAFAKAFRDALRTILFWEHTGKHRSRAFVYSRHYGQDCARCGNGARREWPYLSGAGSGAMLGRILMPTLRPRVNGGDVREHDGRISASASSEEDNLVTAITKWIPIEVIAFYEGVTTPFGDKLAAGLLYAVAAGLIVAFLWTAFATEDAKAKSRIAWRQVILSCFAFAFWVIGTTSPDVWRGLYVWWHPGINPAVLAAAAVVLPIADGIMKRLGVPQD
jgi:hypothetical protein